MNDLVPVRVREELASMSSLNSAAVNENIDLEPPVLRYRWHDFEYGLLRGKIGDNNARFATQSDDGVTSLGIFL